VPPNYDSLLGKLIVWGEDRTQAIARMKRALNELVISGVPTTTQYHEMILEIDDFVNGNVDTGFIPKHADQLSDPPPPKTSVSPKSSIAFREHAGVFCIGEWAAVRRPLVLLYFPYSSSLALNYV